MSIIANYPQVIHQPCLAGDGDRKCWLAPRRLACLNISKFSSPRIEQAHRACEVQALNCQYYFLYKENPWFQPGGAPRDTFIVPRGGKEAQVAESVSDLLGKNPIDSRLPKPKAKTINPSIVDGFTEKLRNRLQDPYLGERFVAKILQHLSEKDIEDALDYVERKSTLHKGKAFVVLCTKIMQYKTL